MNLWQHKIEENKWEVTQWATNPDSLAGLQSSLVAESKIEHWHSELRCWLLTPRNLGFKMAPDPHKAGRKTFSGEGAFCSSPWASTSAESPTSVEVSGRVPGQLGTSCSLSKAALQAEVKQHCTGWALPWQWLGPSADRQGSDGVMFLHLSPGTFSTPGCPPDTSHWQD